MTDSRVRMEESELENDLDLQRTPTFVNLAHVQSAGTTRSTRSRRRTSALESPTADIRRRSSSVQHGIRDDLDEDTVLSLAKSASRISGHHQAYQESRGRVFPSKPVAARTGGFDVIKEVPTPFGSRKPSPTRIDTISRPASPLYSDPESLSVSEGEGDDDEDIEAYPDIGRIKSWRGATILGCVCGAQLMDNVFMTGVNIALPAIQKEFDVSSGNLQWLISAYSLTFGGFLLLSGVLADRYGRRNLFCAGMIFLSVWTVANGFATSFIQMTIFRALQGIGAAATVPSSVGIISSYFVAKDRSRGLSMFGAAGAVGFCVGLIFGGFLTASVGWRYLFYLSVALTGPIAIVGWFILPKDRIKGDEKPKLDFVGVGLSTTGLILLSFVLSSGSEYGWSKAFIIALLIISVASLFVFTWVEKKVSNPIMPLSLWKLKNFASLWISGALMYGGYQTIIYFTVLIAQEVQHLSASETAIRYLPMGAAGFATSLSMGKLVDKVNHKILLLLGMLCCAVAPISAATMAPSDLNFWRHVFPATILGVVGVSLGYCTITVVLLSSVPLNVKSLCAGMINTGYQIGSGIALALSTAIIQAVDVKKGHSELTQYETGLWCCVGFGGLGLLASAIGVRNTGRPKAGGEAIAMH